MSAVSYALTFGEATGANGVGYNEDAITLGTSAPGATSTIELRVDLTTAPTRKDICLAVYAFLRRIEGGRFGPSDFGTV